MKTILVSNDTFRTKAGKIYYRLTPLISVNIDQWNNSQAFVIDDQVNYAVSVQQFNYLLAQSIGWERVNHGDWVGVRLELIDETAEIFSTEYRGDITYYPKVAAITEVTWEDEELIALEAIEERY